MNSFEIITGGLLILCSVVIILLVLAQEGKSNGMAAMTGGSDAFGDMQSRTADARIAKTTKYFAIVFFVLSIAVGAVSVLVK